jgi:death-on-curing protein
MEPIFLTVDEVLEIHEQQIELYGGSHGVRDMNLLESALGVPHATFGGEYLHPTIGAMAAAYMFHITQNHPFFDGNKRTGANASITFLLLNNTEPTFDEDALVDLVLNVTQGGVTKEQVIQFFQENARPLTSE